MKLFCRTLYDAWIEIDLNDKTLVLQKLREYPLPSVFQKSQYRNITQKITQEFFRGLESFIPHLIEVYEYTRDFEGEPPQKIQRKSDGNKKKNKKSIENNNKTKRVKKSKKIKLH